MTSIEALSQKKIEVFVFRDKERYSNYSAASERTRGSATTNEIYISPIIRDRIDTFSSILMHELSHVHIRQYIGTWNYVNDIPGLKGTLPNVIKLSNKLLNMI